MNNQEKHEKLIQDYSNYAFVVKKMNFSGMFIQFGIIMTLGCFHKIQIPYSKLAIYLLFSLSIYFFVKDFLTFRRMENYGVQIISEGVELEDKNNRIDRFFQDVLENFNLIKALSSRFLINTPFFMSLGYLVRRFILDVDPKLSLTDWILIGLCAGTLSALTCKLYYSSLKPLELLQKNSLKTATS